MHSFAAVLLTATFALACVDTLSPAGVAGVYALRNVLGESLPAVSSASSEVTVRVFADTLRLRANGSGRAISVIDIETHVDGIRSGITRNEGTLRYRTTGGRIEVTFDCPINASCVALPRLVLRPTGLGLRAEYAIGARVPRLYARIVAGQ